MQFRWVVSRRSAKAAGSPRGLRPRAKADEDQWELAVAGSHFCASEFERIALISLHSGVCPRPCAFSREALTRFCPFGFWVRGLYPG